MNGVHKNDLLWGGFPQLCKLGFCQLNLIANDLIEDEGIGEHVAAGGGKKIHLLQDVKFQLVKPVKTKRSLQTVESSANFWCSLIPPGTPVFVFNNTK